MAPLAARGIRLMALGAILAFVLPGAVQAQQITGAGGTFPAPLYQAWARAAQPAIGIQLDYQAIGSAGGQEQILNRTVDFGASDAPVDPAVLQAGNLLQLPTVMGAVVVIVNIPGIGMNQLQLPAAVLAGIYAGTITQWNDPRIAAVNQGLNLPNLSITPIHRADGSGTTFVWTSYLCAISATWKNGPGAGTTVNWPAGAGARGNDGVATLAGDTSGAIGYVESTYAVQHGLVTARIQNKMGDYIAPTPASFQAAAAQANWLGAKNFAVNIINMPGGTSWPIVSATFILLPKDPDDPAQSDHVVAFLRWAYSHGGGIALSLNYVPLPAPVQAAVLAAIASQIGH